MIRDQSVFPDVDEGALQVVEGPVLQRVGHLSEYYDWPALHRTRTARRLARAIGSVTDAMFLPLILVAPSIGFTIWIGGRAATSGIRRALGRRRRVLAHIERSWRAARTTHVSRLPALPDDTAVRVRGRIRVREPESMTSTLFPDQTIVYEWLMIREELLPERAFFVERGKDFEVVAEDGSSIRVGLARARVVVEWRPEARLVAPDVAARLERAVPRCLAGRRALSRASLAASGLFLSNDSLVEILGFTSRVIDPHAPALPRDMPSRCKLVGRERQPLIIKPEAALLAS